MITPQETPPARNLLVRTSIMPLWPSLCTGVRTWSRAAHVRGHCSAWRLATATATPRLYSTNTTSGHSASSHAEDKNVHRGGFGKAAVVIAVSVASGSLGFFLSEQNAKRNSSQSVPDSPKFGSPSDFKNAIDELHASLTPDAVSTDPEDLRHHGFSDNDYHPTMLHSVVVYPQSTEDVVKIVKIATKYRMPVIPYSGATSLEGHFRGHSVGGICVDVGRMDKVLEIHEEDSDLVCQPGAQWMDINEMLKKKGIPLFFPIDPGPGATVGGMLSTGCSGTNAVRYGTAKGEWFLNATVVLPSGEVIKTRSRSRKSAAGFDITKLFIGAEGTLGIVTELTIRLAPVLQTSVAVVQFPDVKSATAAATEVINQGLGIQCVELLDATSMRATNNYGMSIRKWPERDSLFFKFQGPSQASLKDTAKAVEKVVAKHSGTGFSFARNEKEAEDLWMDRKNIYWSALSLIEGSRGMATDVCVPVSKLPELVYETKKDLENVGILSSIVGHVGDGNFHALLLFTNDDELKIAQKAAARIVHRAIAMDGTCTGEHGVGIGKKKYLVEELGQGTVDLMKTVKRAIDPLGLFNPGKLYPESNLSGAKHHPDTNQK
ncbi:D-lactate dehydrogenase [cytochrome], mitochondrial [Psilocybe cubensis]|uniref:D-lactate dehydrogenase [cytochrome], mitochondrial n=2 Tax=Psilocybe cubensis TaxID=181762 RepID=A0ACB8H081_PSICU|nr:D-lactate dehydrogenase [cytochrome], mitochondrial [Psilocybe cubensis]KAH9480896.1 D-lactate dehydrogenase [cytochrome], mitochondrial [Psilocybe cubensis]